MVTTGEENGSEGVGASLPLPLTTQASWVYLFMACAFGVAALLEERGSEAAGAGSSATTGGAGGLCGRLRGGPSSSSAAAAAAAGLLTRTASGRRHASSAGDLNASSEPTSPTAPATSELSLSFEGTEEIRMSSELSRRRTHRTRLQGEHRDHLDKFLYSSDNHSSNDSLDQMVSPNSP
jgi:hypothetical protein